MCESRAVPIIVLGREKWMWRDVTNGFDLIVWSSLGSLGFFNVEW